MLNLPETLITTKNYFPQRDFYIRAFTYSVGSFSLVAILRAQVCEIDLLQLIPGFYMLLIFLGYVVMVLSSNFLLDLPRLVDCKKESGTKTETRIALTMIAKFSMVLFSVFLYLSVFNLLPLSLDIFESYENQQLLNLWSFEEVINVEWTLLLIVLTVTQVPNLVIFYITNETDAKFLPAFWETFSFLVFIIAGIITPTVDGYTQLYFAFAGIALYFTIVNIVEKRMTFKFFGNLSLSF